MRWFFGLFKIMFVVLALAFTIKAVFVYIPEFNARVVSVYRQVEKFISGKEKGMGKIGTEKSGAVEQKNDGENNKEIVFSTPEPENEEVENQAAVEEDSDIEEEVSASDTAGQESVKEEYFLTAEEVYAIDNVNPIDLFQGIYILRKLEQTDINWVMGMARDGITYEEAKKLKEILEGRLSMDEVRKLDNIMQKNRRLYAEGKLKVVN